MTSDPCKAVYLVDTPPQQTEMFAGLPDLLTPQHIANETGMSAQTVRRLINQGEIPGCRIGQRLYAPKTKFIQFVEGGNYA